MRPYLGRSPTLHSITMARSHSRHRHALDLVIAGIHDISSTFSLLSNLWLTTSTSTPGLGFRSFLWDVYVLSFRVALEHFPVCLCFHCSVLPLPLACSLLLIFFSVSSSLLSSSRNMDGSGACQRLSFLSSFPIGFHFLFTFWVFTSSSRHPVSPFIVPLRTYHFRSDLVPAGIPDDITHIHI